MGIYKGTSQDNVTINSGTASLQSLAVTGATALTGALTVTGGIVFPVQALAAAGSSNTDAGVVTSYGVVHATAANGTKGIKLPAAKAGAVVIVKNSDAANGILKVYPDTGDKINSGTATTGALSMAAKTAAMFVAIDATDWFTIPLLPS